MCGIAGYIDKSGIYKTNCELVKRMTDKMIHRGPDAEGQWADGNVALGHRRLSIIDLDARSNQPLFSHDMRFAIVFNGEIYNYIEIKSELIKRGAIFKTNSDTEVIIEAYRKYGIDCFNMFNGMWALAIYDIKKWEVILCRDRFGVKPLYIVDNDNVFAFASEMKAIVAAFPQENIPNETWIYQYISGTIKGGSDEAIFKNIRVFPKAHYMVYDLKLHTKSYKKYWEADEVLFFKKWIEGRNPVRLLKKLFENAVEIRLRADVEIGAALSGGLDSSAIVGCASKKYGKKIHTFSSIYQDKECNEEFFIQKVNQKFNTVPHYVRPDDYEKDFTKYISDLIYYQDWPYPTASGYSGYMVKKETQKFVKISLSGQGADELFAGYNHYLQHYIFDLLDKNTFKSKCQGIGILAYADKRINCISTDAIVRLAGVKNCFLFRSEDGEKLAESDIRREVPLFTDVFLNKVDNNCNISRLSGSSKLNTALLNDIINQSLPLNLQSEDSEAMAFSIETRMPFLDYRIVEFAIALDGKYKIRRQWMKWIIRKACRKYLPKEVAVRRDKMGFPAPFARWLREGSNKDQIKEIIYAFGDRNIVPRETIDKFYSAHINMKADLNNILYRFYSMELWMRIWDSERHGDKYMIEN